MTPPPRDADGPALYRDMVRVRRVEERLQILYNQGAVNGPAHLSTGQEAIAVGSASALEPTDYALGTYRGHGHVIARGASLEAVIGELLGRQTGLCGGKGGSMHLTSVEHGYYGSYAIVGSQLPIACGFGWAAEIRDDDRVTVCYFGDGATNIGAFHEALNLAAVWELPVLFVCENNHYMEYTPIEDMISVERPAADRAGAYGLEPVTVDGNDVEAVAETVGEHAERARSGNGPALIEAETYRFVGHSAADPGAYRSDEEVDQWRERDPIPRLRERLVSRGVDPTRIDEIETNVEEEVRDAVTTAREAPRADPEAAWSNVWADGGWSWRN